MPPERQRYTMIKVREINQIESLCEFRNPWQMLLDETPGASFFHSLDWLECYWNHFSAGQQLRVLVVTENRQPIGIMPLVVRTESTRVGRLRILTYPLHDWATFFSPIGPHPSATLVAALRHLRQTPRNWDLLDLRWVDVHRTDQGRTERAMAQTGFRPCGQKWDRTSLVELPERWQDYWQCRDVKFRKNIDRLERQIAEQGKVKFVRFRPVSAYGGEVDPRWDVYDACASLAERSWQGRRGDKTNLCHAGFDSFFREAHVAAARRGAADLSLLYFNDDPAAFMMNYHWQGAVYGLRRGFDPQFKHLRPGLVLQKMMLEDGHRRGDRCYDLGTGSYDVKEPWRTSLQTSYRYTFFPTPVVRGQLLWLNRWFRHRLHGDHDIACSS